eukprot:3374784-Amphidinium_carterae.1
MSNGAHFQVRAPVSFMMATLVEGHYEGTSCAFAQGCGFTALHYAARPGYGEVVKLLLQSEKVSKEMVEMTDGGA